MVDIKICVIGATGNVGRKVIAMLIETGLVKPSSITTFASPKSSGTIITIINHDYIIYNAETADFSDFDICIFNTESDISSALVPKAIKAGAYVIDSSSHYRLSDDVPLIIPPVNKDQVTLSQKLYSHANCLASPIATVISPLHRVIRIKRINAVTYQSTSGAGKRASDDCWDETIAIVKNEAYERKHFARQIAFNVIPQVGDIKEDGSTSEEYKIIHEVKKVVDQKIAITATSVRVPVIVGHSIAMNIEFQHRFNIGDIIRILKNAPSIQLNNNHHHYNTPADVLNMDDVFVGRVRLDTSIENGLHMWLCSDNLRRGAATDTVEIAVELINLLNKQS